MPEGLHLTQAEAIREARARARMTQEHLARAAGVSEKTVRRAERNERISHENLRALCAVVGLDALSLTAPNEAVAGGGDPEALSDSPPAAHAPVERLDGLGDGDSPGRVRTGTRDHEYPRTAKYAVFLISTLAVGLSAAYGANKNANAAWQYEADTMQVVTNPDFAREAAREGYRIELGRNLLAKWVVARCMRSNADGPLPCGRVNRPAGRVGEAMEIVPAELPASEAAPGKADGIAR